MPPTLRWLAIHTSTPARISAAAMSAWMSEKPIARSGFRSSMRSTLAEVKADTRGFSARACAGRTVKPEMPTMRLLLAQGVQHLGGFFGEADDALRADGHG